MSRGTISGFVVVVGIDLLIFRKGTNSLHPQQHKIALKHWMDSPKSLVITLCGSMNM